MMTAIVKVEGVSNHHDMHHDAFKKSNWQPELTLRKFEIETDARKQWTHVV